MECFVLDDGWFGKRDNDRSSLGDWVPDPAKFPNGIGHFAKQIHDLGLQLGVWFEPEMVSPDSQLYQNIPIGWSDILMNASLWDAASMS